MEKVLFSSKSDLWSTPHDLFDSLDQEFYFDIDVTPYGRDIVKWIENAFWSAGICCGNVVMLLPARIVTKWFHEYIYNILLLFRL